jgi:hypothetical protein
MKEKKEQRIICGFSESAWKSLVVKSLRIGWIDGLKKASEMLSKSTMEQLLIAGIFEDLFPGSWGELNKELEEIKNQNWTGLCSHETHHGRGYTDMFCDMEKEACSNARKEGYNIMEQIVQPNSQLKWLNPRVFNCLYTWNKINPKDEGVKRLPFNSPFIGMPQCILDGHTKEGKEKGLTIGLLSGHYDNHRKIGENIAKIGHWGVIRKQFLNQKIIPVLSEKQLSIF